MENTYKRMQEENPSNYCRYQVNDTWYLACSSKKSRSSDKVTTIMTTDHDSGGNDKGNKITMATTVMTRFIQYNNDDGDDK